MKKGQPRRIVLATAVVLLLVPAFLITQSNKPIKVSVKANPSNFNGFCPKKIVFTGVIAVTKPTIILYRWIRSDGAKGPVKKLGFKKAGSRIVTTTWTLGTDGKTYAHFWEAIEVTSPFHILSNRAYFNLRCLRRIVLPDYRISGLVHGGSEGHIIGGRKIIVTIRSGSISRSQTLVLDRDGRANYTFSARLFPGTYTITVRKGPADASLYISTANACYRGAEPASRSVTLAASTPHADNQDFLISFVIAFDRRGDCWED